MSNSSVIGLRDNTDRENGILKDKTVSKLRVQQSNFRAKSPLKPSNFRTLRTNNVVDLVWTGRLRWILLFFFRCCEEEYLFNVLHSIGSNSIILKEGWVPPLNTIE